MTTKILADPHRPAENWKQQLDAWLAEVHTIIEQAKAWAESRGWATKQDPKVIVEEIVGTYEAPALLIHTPQGRLLLEPVARYVVGAEGRFDFCVIPSYEGVPLLKIDDTWAFYSIYSPQRNVGQPWSEQAFEQRALHLLSSQ